MKEFIEKFSTLIIGAFSLLAALAWNDTVKAFIGRYISPGSGLKSMLIYAIAITIIAVIVSIYINKFAQGIIKKEEQLTRKVKNLEDKLGKCENKK